MVEKSFWNHLDDLRWLLVRIIVVWVVLTVGYFVAMPYLFEEVILAPCRNDFVFYELLRDIGARFNIQGDFFTEEFNINLININLTAPFLIHISTAFCFSFITTMPFLLYEIWRFIKPALYDVEILEVRKAFSLGTVMFFLGVAVGYFMVYPMTLRFLASYQLSPDIENTISLSSYIDNLVMLVLCMGLAFELPLVTWMLSVLKVVNKSFLKRYRKHAFVIVVILAAIITPTSDPFTLTIVTIPLYLLYELSIFMIRDNKIEDEVVEDSSDEN